MVGLIFNNNLWSIKLRSEFAKFTKGDIFTTPEIDN